ncbi:MAG: MarR family transcriptional regulator [Curtobacterium sp.]
MSPDIAQETLTLLTRLVIDWSSPATQRAVAGSAGVSIDPADVRALYMLGMSGRTRIGSLARALNQTAPTTSKQIVRLQRRGLVTRTPDPSDQRASRTELSAAGLALVDALNAVTEQRITSALAELPDGQRFAAELRAFTAHLRSPGSHDAGDRTEQHSVD